MKHLAVLVAALVMFSSSAVFAQQSAVFGETQGSKVYLRVDPLLLRGDLDSLFSMAAGSQDQNNNSSWADVLGNGATPGMDVDFFGYDATGLGNVTTTGTFTGDSLVLSKDAAITGRLNVTGVTSFSDSLLVAGSLILSDSLRVVKATSIGEQLYVTGVTALGDSLHVVGNVDFDALFHVDGAATFGSTVVVSGITTLNNSLHVNSGADISGTLNTDSLSVTDVIDGQVSSLGNHDTDDLDEGSANLYFTTTRARAAISEGTGVTITNGAIAIGQAVGTTDDVTFDELYVDSLQATGSLMISGETTLQDSLHVNGGADVSGTLSVDSLSVTDVINGQVSSLGNHNTDDLAEGSNHLYMSVAERTAIESIESMAHQLDSLSCTWMRYHGYVYELILIGDQCWFAENLRSLTYVNGDSIPGNLNFTEWSATTEGALAFYGDDEANLDVHGCLYNWYAVGDSRGLCPAGWHVPSDAEWKTLEMELELTPEEANATDARGTTLGLQLKSSPSDSPSWDGNNATGFTGTQGGYRNFGATATYLNGGYGGYWWSSSTFLPTKSWYRLLYTNIDGIYRFNGVKGLGLSVRCLRN